MVEVQTAGSRLAAASSAGTTGTAAEESAGPEKISEIVSQPPIWVMTTQVN